MKKKGFFEDNYLKCWKFMMESKWFFVFASGIFALTFLIGFAYPVFFRTEIFEKIAALILEVEGKGAVELIGFIFLNNFMTSLFAMMSGIFFGIVPVVTCVFNGYLLGFVAREAVMTNGIFVMWRIFPHGIFELPAVIFSIGIGMRLGLQVVIDIEKVGYVFKEGLRFFVFVVFPLLVIAGIIEGLLIALSI